MRTSLSPDEQSRNEVELLHLYRLLDPLQKEMLLQAAGSMAERRMAKEIAGSSNVVLLCDPLRKFPRK